MFIAPMLTTPLIGICLWLSAISIEAVASSPVELQAISPDKAAECGMKISTPKIRNIYDRPLQLDCNESDVINGKTYNIAKIDYQFDPNKHRVSDNLSFYTYGDNFSKSAPQLIKYFFDTERDLIPNRNTSTRINRSSRTYCGLHVTTTIRPIAGLNWHGWIAEDSYTGRVSKDCESPAEYSPQYRCISMVFGNEKMSAAMVQTCLLRKHESNIQQGLSYEIFMDMLKTLRFMNE
ncbi:hypothetical protein [Burkholderia cepacia]|uniref:hypothetical protein n=1 Tax=Burkholderia cepacia TaxID=292 RepID=UPI001CF5152F|nr:hypothetical protein [Burkholderia cepacia]MCA8349726.1 hypothetical protein [Burkholderia cepacia]